MSICLGKGKIRFGTHLDNLATYYYNDIELSKFGVLLADTLYFSLLRKPLYVIIYNSAQSWTEHRAFDMTCLSLIKIQT